MGHADSISATASWVNCPGQALEPMQAYVVTNNRLNFDSMGTDLILSRNVPYRALSHAGGKNRLSWT
jgi:hypothetical protein